MGFDSKWNITSGERERQSLCLFPNIDRDRLPRVLRSKRLREEVMADIEKDEETWKAYRMLEPEYQEAVVQFCMGNRGLNVLFDPFFRKIFREEEVGRLESLLSVIMGQKIKIVRDIPMEVTRRGADSSLMIMDLVVRLADGVYVNLEVQRITHDFPFVRAECYASDILVYQYDQLKLETKVLNRPVYVIVLMNSSSEKMNQFPQDYIHRSPDEVRFDTGLIEKTLKRYIYVSLDIFRKMEHNELTELEAWMYFLASDKPEDIRRVIEKYPEFKELYQEIICFRYNPRELMMMVPEAIQMMDEGSFQLMIDRLEDQLEQRMEQLEAQAGQIEAQAGQIEAQAGQIEAQAGQIEAQKERLRSVLTETVENIMKNFNVDMKTACEGAGISVEEYEAMKGTSHSEDAS